MRIIEGGLDDSRVQSLLAHHFASARAETVARSAYALDLAVLKLSDVRFWAAWDGETVIGTLGLKRLSESHGELISMHTEQTYRRKGVGATMFNHAITEARKLGLSRLSLETGAWPYFAQARRLYSKLGFVECPPFGGHVADSSSVFMMLDLTNG